MKIAFVLSCMVLLAATASAANPAWDPVKYLHDNSDLIVVALFPFAEKDFEKGSVDALPILVAGQEKMEYRRYATQLKIIKVLKGSLKTKGYLQVQMIFEVPVTAPRFKPEKDEQCIVFLMHRLRGKPEPVESENEYFYQNIDIRGGYLKADKATLLKLQEMK